MPTGYGSDDVLSVLAYSVTCEERLDSCNAALHGLSCYEHLGNVYLVVLELGTDFVHGCHHGIEDLVCGCAAVKSFLDGGLDELKSSCGYDILYTFDHFSFSFLDNYIECYLPSLPRQLVHSSRKSRE